MLKRKKCYYVVLSLRPVRNNDYSKLLWFVYHISQIAWRGTYLQWIISKSLFAVCLFISTLKEFHLRIPENYWSFVRPYSVMNVNLNLLEKVDLGWNACIVLHFNFQFRWNALNGWNARISPEMHENNFFSRFSAF